MSTTNNATADIDDFIKQSMSILDLDSNELKGDLGLSGHVLTEVSYDTVVVTMSDVQNGYKKDGNLLFSTESDIKAWRRATVIMVGPQVRTYKVGDMVIFPGVKGLEAGQVYVNINNNITPFEKVHFLSESRIFGKVVPFEDGSESIT